MKICIYGAGAVGGLMAAWLSEAGLDVSVVARGPQLEAIARGGLRIRSRASGATLTARPRAASDPRQLGPQDYVIVTLKANSVPRVMAALQPLLGPDTAVVTAANGVPWWYFYQLEGPWRDRRLQSVDPGGGIWDGIGPQRALGCVVYPACEVVEPGVIEHINGDRFVLGEPDGSRSQRAQALSAALVKAGFKAPVRPRIRDEIWLKLWGNLCFNPLSALTLATLDILATDPGTRSVARAMMVEAQAIGERLGVRFAIDVDKRIAGAAAVGAHRTSMLQDLERGRPLEIDALVTAVQEMGRLVELPTPTIDTVLALIQQRARSAGCY